MMEQLADREAMPARAGSHRTRAGDQRKSGDSSQLRLRVQVTRQDHRDKAGLRSSHGVKSMTEGQSLNQQCLWPGMGITMAQLQDSSAGDKSKSLSLKATLKGRNGDLQAMHVPVLSSQELFSVSSS